MLINKPFVGWFQHKCKPCFSLMLSKHCPVCLSVLTWQRWFNQWHEFEAELQNLFALQVVDRRNLSIETEMTHFTFIALLNRIYITKKCYMLILLEVLITTEFYVSEYFIIALIELFLEKSCSCYWLLLESLPRAPPSSWNKQAILPLHSLDKQLRQSCCGKHSVWNYSEL